MGDCSWPKHQLCLLLVGSLVCMHKHRRWLGTRLGRRSESEEVVLCLEIELSIYMDSAKKGLQKQQTMHNELLICISKRVVVYAGRAKRPQLQILVTRATSSKWTPLSKYFRTFIREAVTVGIYPSHQLHGQCDHRLHARSFDDLASRSTGLMESSGPHFIWGSSLDVPFRGCM